MYQTFVIHLKPQSWNTLLNRHYWIVKEIKDNWKKATQASIVLYDLKPVRKYPIAIHVHACWKQKRLHDIDNIVFKFVLDEMVSRGILKGDSLKFVNKVTYSGEIGGGEDRLVITIEEPTS